MKTVYVLIRNLKVEDGVDRMELSDDECFLYVGPGAVGIERLTKYREIFPIRTVRRGDWVYERSYEEIPTERAGPDDAGMGDIPFHVEDLLLSLRLLKPGDVSFVVQTITDDQGAIFTQLPYRYFGDVITLRPYYLDPRELSLLHALRQRVGTPAAFSPWFSVAKRYFLFGGAKEFQPLNGEVDRILDYGIALEAVLMFEADFVSRLIKRRAVGLLQLNAAHSALVWSLLNKFYGYRSKIAHGDALTINNLPEFRKRMDQFEGLVRDVLRRALAVIPAAEYARRQALESISVITDEDRLDQLAESAKRLSEGHARTHILAAIHETTL